jgi:large subunit ribosomal protein L21e
MPHSFGYRAQTRTLFKKKFKTTGVHKTSTYLRTFKQGDYVDIKVDSAVHKGMPFKYYHGRTGVIFNVNKRAVGIDVKKQVNGRIIKKQLHVGIEHIAHSKCRNEVIRRKVENETIKAKVRSENLPKQSLKRSPRQPKAGYSYKVESEPETIQPLPYVDLF